MIKGDAEEMQGLLQEEGIGHISSKHLAKQLWEEGS